MKDSYYTPESLANYLTSLIDDRDFKKVADFCVGEGRLLTAAYSKWPNAQLYGTDVCPKVIKRMKSSHPNWNFGKCDFLNSKSRNANPILRQEFDLILSNPPFSCKGSKVNHVTFDNITFQVSDAMAFIIEAMKYLEKDGVMYAILPQSCGYSNKDKKIREYLIEKYNFRILEEREEQSFDDCSPNIILVSINDKSPYENEIINAYLNTDKKISIKRILRGNISMFKVDKHFGNEMSLIHSTNIRDHKIINIAHRVKSNRSVVKGPAVLIHRVGNPSFNKICIISSQESYVISDCIIGIELLTERDCNILFNYIKSNWSYFHSLYKGTGAKFITIERLYSFLENII